MQNKKTEECVCCNNVKELCEPCDCEEFALEDDE